MKRINQAACAGLAKRLNENNAKSMHVYKVTAAKSVRAWKEGETKTVEVESDTSLEYGKRGDDITRKAIQKLTAQYGSASWVIIKIVY